MKRYVITLTSVAAVAVPTAVAAKPFSHTPEIYGQVHFSANQIDNDETEEAEDSALNLSSNSSRFGIRGSEEIDNGLTGLYQLEVGVHWGGQGTDKTSTTDDDSIWRQVRDSYVGLEGDFGKLITGRLPASNQYIYDANFFVNRIGDPGELTGSITDQGGRQSGAVQYTAPLSGPFGASATLTPSGNGADEHPAILRGTYEQDDFFGALTYLNEPNAEDTNDLQHLVVSGSYQSNGLEFAGMYGTVLDDDDRDEEDAFATLGAAYALTEKGTIKGQYTAYMADADQNDAALTAIGYDYTFSERTTGYLILAHMDNDREAEYRVDGYGHGGTGNVDDMGTPNPGADPNALSVGVVHDF